MLAKSQKKKFQAINTIENLTLIIKMIISFLLMLILQNGLTTRPDTSILYSRLGIIVIFYSSIATLASFYITYLEKGISMYGGLFDVTSFTHSLQTFIFLICAIILTMTGFYPRKEFLKNSFSILEIFFRKIKEFFNVLNKAAEQFTIIEYALIVIFIITGAIFLISSADLGSIYLCIELQSFSLYIISSLYRNSEASTGSALIYFLLGGLSSCFILLGIAIIFSNSGLINLEGWYCLVSDSEQYVYFSTWYMHTFVFFCLMVMSIGFLFKIAAAPFHWWSPDVYDGVPTIVTTIIALMGKIAILLILLELVYNTSSLLYSTIQVYSWTTSLTVSCFFSLIIGTVLGLTQTRIKKLLAYSTISHVGFILLGLSSSNITAYRAYIFYIIQYILTNLTAFIIVIGMGNTLYLYYTNFMEYNKLTEKNNSPIQLIRQLKGFFSINPVLTLLLIIVVFSFIGLPPLVGFFGKQMILTAALDSNRIILVLTAIVTSVIGAVYYLNLIKTLSFFDPYYEKFSISNISLSNGFTIIIGLLTLLILLFIFIPDELINHCNLLTNSDYSNNTSLQCETGKELINSADILSKSENVDEVSVPMYGIRCPVCLKNNQEVWVIPGQRCHKCGHAC